MPASIQRDATREVASLAVHSRRTETHDLATEIAGQLPQREKQPIWNALRDACVAKCQRVDRLRANPPPKKGGEGFHLARTVKWLAEISTEVGGFIELLRWLQPDEPMSAKEARESILLWAGQNGKEEDLKRLVRRIGRRERRGHPITRREVAIQALEFHVTTKTTWLAIAAHTCPCSKPSHGKSCAEAIRRNVIRLKAILRKYSIPIPN